MKYCLDKYPLGSFPGQKTAGRYMEETLYNNLKVLAKNMPKDMTHLGFLFSSTLEVGTGKSTLAQQIGEAWTEMIKEMHGVEVPFDMQNIVFKPRDLIDRAFKLPKYSCIILDEWEDNHYWSELGITLRTFFRKCRQLNLFILCIIPNFFQLPIGYAVSRSTFAIDVRFEGEFDRGFFRFYSFPSKKNLYILGKRTHNYDVAHHDFQGRFFDGYAVPEKEYRAVKLKDMEEYDEDVKKSTDPKALMRQTVLKIKQHLPITSVDALAKSIGVSENTIYNWANNEKEEKDQAPSEPSSNTTEILSYV